MKQKINQASLKKGIVIILGANLLNLMFSVLANILLPKFLSLNCYAEIKTFQLYVGYCGILHLGYEDGLYIKYGGKSLREIDQKRIKEDLSTLSIFQLTIVTVLIGIAMFLNDFTLIACTIAVFPLNIISCYKLLFQATGEFDLYARVSNVVTIMTFTINIALLLLGFSSEYKYYLCFYVGLDFLVMCVCVRLFKKRSAYVSMQNRVTFSWKLMIDNIKSGIFLMFGNFSSMILTGMDRWFIKALMDNTAFAMYSFAVSMEGLMNVVVSPISTTLYNYFCLHIDKTELIKKKNMIVLFSTAVVSCAFPAKFILETFLSDYLEAVDVMFYLFSAQIFYIIVKCFYVNLYKAQKKQNLYFFKLTIVITFGFVLNAILYHFIHTKEAFAIGTMLCGMIWLFLSEMDFREIRSGVKEVLYLFFSTSAYLIIGMHMESIPGMVAYISLLSILATVFMKPTVDASILMAKNNKKWK